ncbi:MULTISPECIES: 23S rRNA accumulation protein YceD [Rheinheimera]|uniref:Large ribosomal RNA subunit accumulation protein YceD n=2 Tax=Gammaproteobacteria TaxID=1236 RepID=A0ABV9JQA3_9GAMM
MQKVKIPIVIDPVRAAQKRSSFDGIVPLANLDRLSESLLDPNGDVEVTVHCGTDEQGLTYIEGEARCQIQVRCERCGDAMPMELDASFAYTPIRSDIDSAHDDIPERYDVIEKNEHGEVNLRQLVEDELILALPLFPTHDEGQCDPAKVQMSWGEIEPEPEKPNPFAILQELKKK